MPAAQRQECSPRRAWQRRTNEGRRPGHPSIHPSIPSDGMASLPFSPEYDATACPMPPSAARSYRVRSQQMSRRVPADNPIPSFHDAPSLARTEEVPPSPPPSRSVTRSPRARTRAREGCVCQTPTRYWPPSLVESSRPGRIRAIPLVLGARRHAGPEKTARCRRPVRLSITNAM